MLGVLMSRRNEETLRDQECASSERGPYKEVARGSPTASQGARPQWKQP